MTATAPASNRPQLTVIEGGLRTLISLDWQLEEARAELVARRSEEQAMDVSLAPVLRRLRVFAKAAGGMAFRDIAAVQYLLDRHARRWADEEEIAA